MQKSARRAMAAAMLASTLLAGHSVAFAQPAAPQQADSGRTMDAPYIAVPVVRNGRLVNYLFVNIRIDVAGGVDLWSTRERAHFLRDALVRAAHAGPLADSERDDRLNQQAAVAAFTAAAREALGPRAVHRLSITSVHSSRPVATAAR